MPRNGKGKQMSRDGSGNYVAPSSSWNPATNGNLATSGDWQALLNDIVAALTQSVSRDGQTVMTGNLQMGGNKITGQSAGSGAGQALIYEQLFNQGTEQDLASAATTDIGAQLTNFLRITGTTTITSFGTNYKGPRFIRFEGAVTLTNGSALTLPGGANITTSAGDCLIVIPRATLGTADGWQVVAYQRAASVAGGATTSGTATVALTNVNVTLDASQAAYPVITFTGTLTGNVNVIFPNDIKSYRILNNTTGAFTVTCKTSAGTGIVVPAGSSDIFCNGTNIVSNATPTAQITSKIEPVTASVASNALTCTLNPTTLDFRSSTITSGTVNTRTIATAISAVVPSGATLGTTNATLSKVMLLAIDNAGTVELAVCNSSLALDESTLISTTVLDAAADSASVIYSTTARTNVPFRIVGYVESTQTTAGTWYSSPSKIQGIGGQIQSATASGGSSGGITSGTAVTASGTSVDFTSIPAGVKRITVMFSGVSTNGTSNILIQIGSGSVTTSGYTSGGTYTSNSSTFTAYTTGIGINNAIGSGAAIHGSIVLSLVNNLSNIWVGNGALGDTAGSTYTSGGSKTLSGILDRVRITTVNGTDTFDAGTINLLWE